MYTNNNLFTFLSPKVGFLFISTAALILIISCHFLSTTKFYVISSGPNTWHETKHQMAYNEGKIYFIIPLGAPLALKYTLSKVI